MVELALFDVFPSTIELVVKVEEFVLLLSGWADSDDSVLEETTGIIPILKDIQIKIKKREIKIFLLLL
jgi:hypothetical protein